MDGYNLQVALLLKVDDRHRVGSQVIDSLGGIIDEVACHERFQGNIARTIGHETHGIYIVHTRFGGHGDGHRGVGKGGHDSLAAAGGYGAYVGQLPGSRSQMISVVIGACGKAGQGYSAYVDVAERAAGIERTTNLNSIVGIVCTILGKVTHRGIAHGIVNADGFGGIPIDPLSLVGHLTGERENRQFNLFRVAELVRESIARHLGVVAVDLQAGESVIVCKTDIVNRQLRIATLCLGGHRFFVVRVENDVQLRGSHHGAIGVGEVEVIHFIIGIGVC